MPDASIDSPTQVRNAFLLLWASLALTTLESGIALFELGFSDDEDVYVYLSWLLLLLVTYFVLLYANAYFIYCASRRKNWARIVLLALFLLFQVLNSVTRVIWPEYNDEDFFSLATTSAYFVMDSVALYWLFSGAGARWYAAN